jgi:hypothetical protein
MAPDETTKPSPNVPRLRPAPVARVPFEYLGLLRLDELGYVSVVGEPGGLVDSEPRKAPKDAPAVSLRGRGPERPG